MEKSMSADLEVGPGSLLFRANHSLVCRKILK